MIATATEVITEKQTSELRGVQHTACCVVGGGPAGAMMALLLARRGVHVTLLEAHKDFDRQFRGDTLHPSVLEILDQIGLAEPIHQFPHAKATGPVIQFADGPFQPFDLTRLKTKFPYVLMIPQVRFLEFITAEAAKCPAFRLVMGANVRKLVEENGVVRGVQYESRDGMHEVRADLVVGADGRFSKIRQLAGIEPVGTAPPMDVLWFRLPRLPEDMKLPGGVLGGIGRGKLLIVLDRADHFQVGLVFPKGQYQDLRQQGIEGIRETIAVIEPRLIKNAAALTDWKQVSLLSVQSNRCDRWHKPGLLLIGDAAHAMSPVAGVGINYAIQDAVVAVNVLAGPLKAGNVTQAHLAKVQRLRDWPTRAIQALQGFFQKNIIENVLHSGLRPRIPLPLRIMTRIPFVRNLPGRMFAFGARRVRLKEV